VDNSQLVTPGPLALTLTGYAPTVTGTGGTVPVHIRRRPIVPEPWPYEQDDEEVLLALCN
jgi:hypothetical protein